MIAYPKHYDCGHYGRPANTEDQVIFCNSCIIKDRKEKYKNIIHSVIILAFFIVCVLIALGY